jgi:hypothetical protein
LSKNLLSVVYNLSSIKNKNMKKTRVFLKASLLLCAAAWLTGCNDANTPPEAITVPDAAALTQNVFADQTQGASEVAFVTDGAWTSAVDVGSGNPQPVAAGGGQQAPPAAAGDNGQPSDWISITPDHGDGAGSYTIAIVLEPNYTGANRTATITIMCNGTAVTITVTQNATCANGTPPTTAAGQGAFKYILANGMEYPVAVSGATQETGYATPGSTLRKIGLTFYNADNSLGLTIYFLTAADRLVAGTYSGIPCSSATAANAQGFFICGQIILNGIPFQYRYPQSAVTVSLTGNVYSVSLHINMNGSNTASSATATGNALLTGTYTGVIPLTNTASATGITLNHSTLTLVAGSSNAAAGSATLTATLLPSGVSQTLTWSNSNPAVVAFDPTTGVVTALAAGTATITVTTANGLTATCTIVVTGSSNTTGSGGWLRYTSNGGTEQYYPIHGATQEVINNGSFQRIAVRFFNTDNTVDMTLDFFVGVIAGGVLSERLPAGTYSGIPATSAAPTAMPSFYLRNCALLNGVAYYSTASGSSSGSVTVSLTGNVYTVSFELYVFNNATPPSAGKITGMYTGVIPLL